MLVLPRWLTEGASQHSDAPASLKRRGFSVWLAQFRLLRRMHLNGGEGLPEHFLCYYSVCGGKGGWMPKVSTQVQRRIAELDAKYTVAQPKRPRRIVRQVLAIIILAIIGVAAFSSANHTTSDFTRLTLKQGPARAMWGATSTGFKSGE